MAFLSVNAGSFWPLGVGVVAQLKPAPRPQFVGIPGTVRTALTELPLPEFIARPVVLVTSSLTLIVAGFVVLSTWVLFVEPFPKSTSKACTAWSSTSVKKPFVPTEPTVTLKVEEAAVPCTLPALSVAFEVSV